MRVRMELFAKIRRDARVEGVSIRGLAKRYEIGRDTVRQAWADPVPKARKAPERSSPRLAPFKPAIDGMLTEDTTAPRKQRHTSRRILNLALELTFFILVQRAHAFVNLVPHHVIIHRMFPMAADHTIVECD
jgi:hypothetical protein